MEHVRSEYGIDIATLLWKDTKNVILCATCVGTMPFLNTNLAREPSQIPWNNRKEKSYIEVNCPQIILEYNAPMGE